MKLWPHQQEAISRAEALHTQRASRLLVQYPTGTGKTVVAIRIGLNWFRRYPFGRVLYVVPSAPVLAAFVRRLAASTRIPVAIEKAGRHAPPQARIIVASQASIWGRVEKYPTDTLLIYDEFKHVNEQAAECLRVAARFAHVVGLDATPWSAGCLDFFKRAERVQLPLRIAQNEGLCARHELAEWTEPRGPWALVFCGSNAECEAASHGAPGSTWIGVNSGQVAERIAAWRAGRVGVMYANRMLTEGFDEPRCDAVWIARESESEILLAQMAGRALRARPGKVARIHCKTSGIREAVARALARCSEPLLGVL